MSDDEESEYETTSEEEEGSEETGSESDEQPEDTKEPEKKAEKNVPSEESRPQTTPNPTEIKNIQPPTHSQQPNADSKDISGNVNQSASGSRQRKMTHARKVNLKSLMLNKAREDLKVEAEHKAEEKKRILNSRIQPLGNLSAMDENELRELCRQLSAKIDTVDEQRYDVEAKVKKNDQEIEDLSQRIFDLRGKFKRPPLRRVKITADQMLRALLGSKHKVSMDLRSNLKSVKKEEVKKEEARDWRENVEAKQGMSGKKAVFEQAHQQESQDCAQDEEEEE